MAVARVTPGAAGHVLLCIGAEIVLVPVDAEGQPVDGPHICPDCILSFADLPADLSPLAPDGGHLTLLGGLNPPSLATCRSFTGFWSRAPPALA